MQRWGVEPDLMALGKAMGGGVMPIGAVLGTERAMGFDDVSTGSTWSWLPASCAAAIETLEIFEREPILEHVRELDRVAREALRPVWDRHACIGDVRVVGCFIAVEFVKDRDDEGARPRAAGGGGVGVRAAGAAGGLQHDVAQPAAVARDAARGHGARRRHPRRGDRRGHRPDERRPVRRRGRRRRPQRVGGGRVPRPRWHAHARVGAAASSWAVPASPRSSRRGSSRRPAPTSCRCCATTFGAICGSMRAAWSSTRPARR